MKKFSLVLVSAALMLAGCQSAPPALPPATPPEQPPPPPVQEPVVSAGPLTKVAVATYMNAQESDLRSLLRGQGVMVARRGDALLVTVPNDKLFDGMSLTSWGTAFVKGVAEILRHYDHTAVDIAAYTDTTGGDEQNRKLSQKRAEALAAAFTGMGVAAERLTAAGLGATNPKVSDGRDPRNRRLEVKITPTPQG